MASFCIISSAILRDQVVHSLRTSIGENTSLRNTKKYVHEEVSDGGYVQLIYNGLGAFIFKNPFARMMREWGLQDLYSHLQRCKKWYTQYHEQLEHEMSDDDFMAIYEQMPEFDDFDDDFVVNEEKWTAQIAAYIDDHIDDFAKIVTP